VERLAGMQAQVAKPPFIGLWTRIDGFEREQLAKAIRKKEVVRGTLMRGTIHLVSRNDYLAWRSPIQPVLTRGAERGKGAYDPVALCEIARKFFDTRPCTFEELRELFPKGDERLMAYTVRMHLPLVMVPDDSHWCYPPNSAFAVAETYLGKKLKASDKPHDLALRYLAAFGPATAKDFERWSGLTGGRALFEELRPKLVTFEGERKRELFDLPGAARPEEEVEAPVRFLPEFDNLLLAYDDRSRIISAEHQPRVATKNLRILATFLVDGFVAGTWSIVRKSKSATLEMTPFIKLDKRTQKALEEEGEKLVRFAEEDAGTFGVRWL
jgi:hypothetical protein